MADMNSSSAPASQLAWPDATHSDGEQAQAPSLEYIDAWWDGDMDASLWWDQSSITAQQAAQLLCRYNPNHRPLANPESDSTDEAGPNYVKILAVFDDLERTTPRHRILKDWMEYAQQRGLKIHSWLGEWIQASGVTVAPSASPPQAAPASETGPHAVAAQGFQQQAGRTQAEQESPQTQAAPARTIHVYQHTVNNFFAPAAEAALDNEPTLAASPPDIGAKPANNWDNRSLERLLRESREPGMTQQKLAERYGVTRQRIAALLNSMAPKKASPFDPLKTRNGKK